MYQTETKKSIEFSTSTDNEVRNNLIKKASRFIPYVAASAVAFLVATTCFNSSNKPIAYARSDSARLDTIIEKDGTKFKSGLVATIGISGDDVWQYVDWGGDGVLDEMRFKMCDQEGKIVRDTTDEYYWENHSENYGMLLEEFGNNINY